jgi:hypothetical protein
MTQGCRASPFSGAKGEADVARGERRVHKPYGSGPTVLRLHASFRSITISVACPGPVQWPYENFPLGESWTVRVRVALLLTLGVPFRYADGPWVSRDKS